MVFGNRDQEVEKRMDETRKLAARINSISNMNQNKKLFKVTNSVANIGDGPFTKQEAETFLRNINKTSPSFKRFRRVERI